MIYNYIGDSLDDQMFAVKARLQLAKHKEIKELFDQMEKINFDKGLKLTAYRLLADLDEHFDNYVRTKNKQMLVHYWTNINRLKSNIPTYVRNYYESKGLLGIYQQIWDRWWLTAKMLIDKLLDLINNSLKRLRSNLQWILFGSIVFIVGTGYLTYRILRGAAKSKAGQEFQTTFGREFGRLPAEVIKAKFAPQTLPSSIVRTIKGKS